MVKPPRNMEPEAVNLDKAGRAAGKAFQDDSFRNYMARKIDLQRKQFGLMIPPAPDIQGEQPLEPPIGEEGQSQHQSQSSSSRAVVRFADNVGLDQASVADSSTSTARRKKKRRSSSSGLHRVMKRLKRRHGRVRRRSSIEKLERSQETSNDEREGVDVGVAAQAEDEEDSAVVVQDDQQAKQIEHSAHSHQSQLQTSTEKENNSPAPPSLPVKSARAQPQQNHHRPDLFFSGVVVLVNGYTNPDTDTLQRLLHKHGGDLERYETSRITHIIAEHLSKAKANMYKGRRRPTPVCYPAWIVDSVKAKRLLPHANYLISEVRGEYGGSSSTTPSITSFLQKPSQQRKSDDRVVGAASVDAERQVVERGTLSSQEGVAGNFDTVVSEEEKKEKSNSPPKDLVVVEEEVVVSPPPPIQADAAVSLMAGRDGSKEQRTTDPCLRVQASGQTSNSSSTEQRTTELSVQMEAFGQAGSSSKEQPSTEPPVQAAASGHAGISNSKEQRSTEPVQGKYINGRIRTVGTDPDFLESFFAASRLSFIGSYKQRAKESPTKKAIRSGSSSRFVFHVDMDCFFAAVVLRKFPEYKDKPVAISHNGQNSSRSDGPQIATTKDSTSECATCNYRAREFGVKKGMYLGRARELCPSLVVLQYDFEGYEEVSEQVTEIVSSHADKYAGNIEQVSCDEAYLELWIDEDGKDARTVAFDIAESIRTEIFETTQCTATVGVASNKFLAKLAGDHVKPNKSFVVDNYRSLLRSLKLRDLHGIGYRLDKKLANEGLVSVQDVWDLGADAERELSRVLGPGTGKKINLFCSGIDNRRVEPAERKTIGAECNYGVRFNGPYGVDHMISGLAKEVEKRMTHVGVTGSKITLKLKQRKPGAPPPPKFLGHGSCHNLSKSCETPNGEATRDSSIISRCGLEMFTKLSVKAEDIRGMGIVVSKLTTSKNAKPRGWKEGAQGSILDLFKKSSATMAQENKTPSVQHHQRDDISTGALNPPNTTNDGVEQDDDDDTATLICEIETPASPPNVKKLSHTTNNSPFELEIVDEEESGDREEEDDEVAVVAGVTRSQHQEDFDIELPSMSQIHLSQVEELPSPMRRQIFSKMENKADEPQQQQPVLSYDTGRVRRGRAHAAAAVAAGGERSSPSTHPAHATKRRSRGDAVRFRQTDMRQVMKLAAVKSRQETIPSGFGEDQPVSLSQLDQLPFGMQLQVVTDGHQQGYCRPPPQRRRRQPTPKSTGVNNNNNTTKTSFVARAAPAKRTNAPQAWKNGEHHHHQDDDDDSTGHSATSTSSMVRIAGHEDHDNFFVDNVQPLAIFLDENRPCLNNDDDNNNTIPEAAVASVVQFLELCMTESRFSDVAILLRSIANRGDEWGSATATDDDGTITAAAASATAFETIFEAVNSKAKVLLGDGLDREWIVGQKK